MCAAAIWIWIWFGEKRNALLLSFSAPRLEFEQLILVPTVGSRAHRPVLLGESARRLFDLINGLFLLGPSQRKHIKDDGRSTLKRNIDRKRLSLGETEGNNNLVLALVPTTKQMEGVLVKSGSSAEFFSIN
jgi:hypothetical protein